MAETPKEGKALKERLQAERKEYQTEVDSLKARLEASPDNKRLVNQLRVAEGNLKRVKSALGVGTDKKAKGGVATHKKPQMMRGGMANKKEHAYAAGGTVLDNLRQQKQDQTGSMIMPPMMKRGGDLKKVPSDNKGLSKLPKNVRNKMGFMSRGGMSKKKK